MVAAYGAWSCAWLLVGISDRNCAVCVVVWSGFSGVTGSVFGVRWKRSHLSSVPNSWLISIYRNHLFLN